MSPEEHYLRAEALLDSCQYAEVLNTDDQGRLCEVYPSTEDDGYGHQINTVGNALLAAQVHATLALAKAPEPER